MVARNPAQSHTERPGILHKLLREKGLERYALFFLSSEDNQLPGGLEETSGFVIDDRGRIHYFWMGWDDEQGSVALTKWKRATPETHWRQSAEYRRARAAAGLFSE